MLWRLWLLVVPDRPRDQGTRSPIELFWTAKKRKKEWRRVTTGNPWARTSRFWRKKKYFAKMTRRSGDVVEVLESNYPKICQRPWLHRPFCEKQERPSKATSPGSKCHFFTGCSPACCGTLKRKFSQNYCVFICSSRNNLVFISRNFSRKVKTVQLQGRRKNKWKLRGEGQKLGWKCSPLNPWEGSTLGPNSAGDT